MYKVENQQTLQLEKPVGKTGGMKRVPFSSKAGRGMYSSYDDFLTKNQTQLTYSVLEGLYKKTKFGAVVDQITGDMMSDGFRIETEDDQANDICKDLIRNWGLNNIESSIQDSLTYGNSFDFKQWSIDGKNILSIQEMTGEFVMPQYNREFDIEKYFYTDMNYEYYPEEVLKLSFNRPKGEHFGFSLLTPAAATLMLLLNSSSNIAVLLDRFAQPIVHWLLDSGLKDPEGDPVKVTSEDIDGFLEVLTSQKQGEDFVTDVSVGAKVYGMDGNIWNFDNALEFLNNEFYAICGVPATLLGYGGSNKEISTRQLKVYFNKISKHQRRFGTQIVESVFQPMLLAQGYDVNPECIWPRKEIEERSERINWISKMWADGVVIEEEYRDTMNFNPIKPVSKQQQTIPISVIQNQLSQAYVNQGPVNEEKNQEKDNIQNDEE
jgi:hypothetical protein